MLFQSSFPTDQTKNVGVGLGLGMIMNQYNPVVNPNQNSMNHFQNILSDNLKLDPSFHQLNHTNPYN
jgi:hypothetical protein